MHYLDPASLSDPLALTQGHLKLFESRGGRFLRGEARTFRPASAGYGVETQAGPLLAREAVICLGPWSDVVTRPLGYRVPMAVKRGYHMHYAAGAGAGLSHPVLDADNGFLLAPMARGIRLTTGAEFARRDSAPDYGQIEASEGLARRLLPLGGRLDAKPWMGCRPCLPDMLPILGPRPPQGRVVQFRSPAPRADPGRVLRPAAGGNDDGRKALRRSLSVPDRAVLGPHGRGHREGRSPPSPVGTAA